MSDPAKSAVRRPAFADDRWYPSSQAGLAAKVDSYLVERRPIARAIGIVAPHAGYFYSGRVAGAIYGAVEVPDRVIVLAVNHRGVGARLATTAHGVWSIPGCDVPIDASAVRVLQKHAPGLVDDASAHELEHSLELQLPFLWRRNPDISLLPVCLGRLSYGECLSLGAAVASTVRELAGETLIVASSDMNHHEPADVSEVKDRKAIDRVMALDPQGLYDTVRRERITMCGVVPTTVMLHAAMALGAGHAELVKYEDSSISSGDKSHVVGYAGMLIRA